MGGNGHVKVSNTENVRSMAVFRVQTLNEISKKGLDRFDRSAFQLGPDLEDPDAILVRSASLHATAFGENLKAIGRAGAGTNNIPVDDCTRKGIVVFNTPGANANAVKGLVLAAMLMVSRNLLESPLYLRTTVFGADFEKVIEKQKSAFRGREIQGKTLAIIGLGAIGTLVANEALSLGLQVEGYDPFISVDKAWGLSRKVKHATHLERMLKGADFISVHVPLSEKTRSLFNSELFSFCKKGATLLNFSRGEIVDEASVILALSSGQLGKYVTDFPTQGLLGVKNLICIPHLGASTKEAEDNCAMMVSDQVSEFLRYGNVANSVNFPDCSLPPSGNHRLIVSNKNVPNMVGQITTLLAAAKINIGEMLNKSQGGVAYNILDLETKPSKIVLDQIAAIEGVLVARSL